MRKQSRFPPRGKQSIREAGRKPRLFFRIRYDTHMFLLGCEKVRVDFPTKTVFTDLTLGIEDGARIVAVDPVAEANFKKRYPEGKHGNGYIEYAPDAKSALKDADLCIIMTEWPEFKALKPEDFTSNMKSAVVFDGRNLYEPADMRNAGIKYTCIGR